MKLFFLVCLISLSVSEDPLRAVLRSPKATLKLYTEFCDKEHLHFEGKENLQRLRLFKKNVEMIAADNEADDGAHYGVNLFSAMTADEKHQYLGINTTGIIGCGPHRPALKSALGGLPTELFWTNSNAVTHVKNQLGCGSCWTFAAAGATETRYKIKSGVLRALSEQEFVDCVDDGSHHDNCMGGWPTVAYQWSQSRGGRLGSEADYPYADGMGSCKDTTIPNALVAYGISGFVNVPGDEDSTIAALPGGALSVAFEVTDHFQQYQSGVMQDRTCTGKLNHGVTAVGYAPGFMLVKNSWGATWGEEGFVKFKRGVYGCGIFQYASYPTLQETGVKDTNPSDPANTYRPSTDEGPTDDGGEDCVDASTFCDSKLCKYPDIAEQYCRLSCGKCTPKPKKECAPGTIRCPDGVCRHQHMC